MTPCPCGSGRDLSECCGPIIAGDVAAPTAEALMRSRYSAYVLGKVEHVERTNDPLTSGDFDRADAEKIARDSQWKGLTIASSEERGDNATVEFTIRFRYQGHDIVQRERSTFRKEDGKWLYVDGEVNPPQTPVVNAVKAGRNDPCPCGSGKKYKKCCGAAA